MTYFTILAIDIAQIGDLSQNFDFSIFQYSSPVLI